MFWKENEISPETMSKTELPKIKLKTIRSVTKKIKLQEVAIQSEYGNALKICKIKWAYLSDNMPTKILLKRSTKTIILYKGDWKWYNSTDTKQISHNLWSKWMKTVRKVNRLITICCNLRIPYCARKLDSSRRDIVWDYWLAESSLSKNSQ